MAATVCRSQLGFTALHLAIKNKQAPIVRKLMDVEGADLNATTARGFTPMMVAAWKGDIDVVQKLITKGADVKAKDTAGRNVWGVAHDWHKEEVRASARFPSRKTGDVGRGPSPHRSRPRIPL